MTDFFDDNYALLTNLVQVEAMSRFYCKILKAFASLKLIKYFVIPTDNKSEFNYYHNKLSGNIRLLSIMETPEQCVKDVKVNNKDTLLLTLIRFHKFFWYFHY